MKPIKGINHWDLFLEYADTNKDREHWLELTEFEQVKVARYMLEFAKREIPGWENIQEFLLGWINDCIEQAKFEQECTRKFCV